jgi:CrcB protein
MQAMHFLAVFIGGGFGSMTRYFVSRQMLILFGSTFPVGTLVVNVLGSFLIGVIATLIANKPQHDLFQFLLITGFLGGFTTFSAFSLETLKFLLSGNTASAFLYIFLSIFLCLFFAYLGMQFTKVL